MGFEYKIPISEKGKCILRLRKRKIADFSFTTIKTLITGVAYWKELYLPPYDEFEIEIIESNDNDKLLK